MTQNDPLPIWTFGALGVGIGGIGTLLGFLTIEEAIFFALFLGMPTWFIGLLWFGIKSDEVLGVEGAFAYEVPAQERTNEDANKE